MRKRTLTVIVVILIVVAGAGTVGLLQAQRGDIFGKPLIPKQSSSPRPTPASADSPQVSTSPTPTDTPETPSSAKRSPRIPVDVPTCPPTSTPTATPTNVPPAPSPWERPPLTPAYIPPPPAGPGPPPTGAPALQPTAPHPTRTPFPPLVTWSPGEEWKTYSDPTYNFSFRYPANWEFEAPSPDDPARCRGVSVRLQNYTMKQYPAAIKIEWNPDLLIVQVGLYSRQIPLDVTIEQWLKTNRVPSPEAVLVDETTEVTANNLPAVRRHYLSGLMIPEGGSLTYYWAYGETLFVASATPGNSKYIGVFDELLHSFSYHE